VTFKYQASLNQIPDCPASDCRPRTFAGAFRYVFGADLNESFIPVAAKQPQRKFKSDGDRCSAWALSFFVTPTAAVQRFEQMRLTSPNIHKAVGDSLAKGSISQSDGSSSEPDTEGHFDLHLYEGVDLSGQFSIIATLVDGTS
jgi:hypothetical protein